MCSNSPPTFCDGTQFSKRTWTIQRSLTIRLDRYVRKVCNRLTVAQAKAYPLPAKLDTRPNQSKYNRQSIGNRKSHPQSGQTEHSRKNQETWDQKDNLAGRCYHQSGKPPADSLEEETYDYLESYSKEKQDKYPESSSSFKQELRVSAEY